MRLRSLVFAFLSSSLLAPSVGAQIESPTPDRSSHLKIGAIRSYHDHSVRDIEAVGNRNIGCSRGFETGTGWSGKSRSENASPKEIESTSQFIRDPAVTEYINQIGQNLVRNSDSQVPFRIRVIDSEEINAVALPGGFFYVGTPD
jgi:hypothetical protein